MPKTARVVISLPLELLAAVDEKCHARGETRSDLFRAALQAFIRREQERAAIEQYIRGYEEQPETDRDMVGIEAFDSEMLAEQPWE